MALTDFTQPSVTGDTVAVRARDGRAEVLLIRRGRPPHEGAWALPGGFLDEYEQPEDAARRELFEETGLAYPGPLVPLGVFGRRGRDPRGWTISIAYLALLDDPDVAVCGSDDAVEAGWFPLDDPPPLAFDHDEIVATARAMLAEGESVSAGT
ncbi:MAG: NUDIX hydrolase [Coriobacteriaceae bacterium]|nr:NUDIX hydrolase [Coriobacteriaceae bacterium]